MSATRSKINPFVNNLLDASREGRLKDVTELVNGKGVSVDSRSKMLETPIMLASSGGHVDVVKALIGLQADLKATDKFGKTALIHAANGGHVDIINLLVKHSHEEVKSPCKWGFTAKDWAEHNGHKEVSKLLIEIEKEVDSRKNGDKNGAAPLELSFVQSLNNDLNEEDVTEVEAPLPPVAAVAPETKPVPQPVVASFVRQPSPEVEASAQQNYTAVELPGPLPMLSAVETTQVAEVLPMEESAVAEEAVEPVLEVESASPQPEETQETEAVQEESPAPAESPADAQEGTTEEVAQEPAEEPEETPAEADDRAGLDVPSDSMDTAFPLLEESRDASFAGSTTEDASAGVADVADAEAEEEQVVEATTAAETAPEEQAALEDADAEFNEEDSFRDVASSDELDRSTEERGIDLSSDSAAEVEAVPEPEGAEQEIVAGVAAPEPAQEAVAQVEVADQASEDAGEAESSVEPTAVESTDQTAEESAAEESAEQPVAEEVTTTEVETPEPEDKMAPEESVDTAEEPSAEAASEETAIEVSTEGAADAQEATEAIEEEVVADAQEVQEAATEAVVEEESQEQVPAEVSTPSAAPAAAAPVTSMMRIVDANAEHEEHEHALLDEVEEEASQGEAEPAEGDATEGDATEGENKEAAVETVVVEGEQAVEEEVAATEASESVELNDSLQVSADEVDDAPQPAVATEAADAEESAEMETVEAEQSEDAKAGRAAEEEIVGETEVAAEVAAETVVAESPEAAVETVEAAAEPEAAAVDSTETVVEEEEEAAGTETAELVSEAEEVAAVSVVDTTAEVAEQEATQEPEAATVVAAEPAAEEAVQDAVSEPIAEASVEASTVEETVEPVTTEVTSEESTEELAADATVEVTAEVPAEAQASESAAEAEVEEVSAEPETVAEDAASVATVTEESAVEEPAAEAVAKPVESEAAAESTEPAEPTQHLESSGSNAFTESHPIDDEEHMTALIWAAFHGELDQVKKLITKLSDVNVVDEHGMTALHFAANAGHAEVVKVLIAAKANINAVDENGSTPFHWAAANCHLDVVDALLAASADINAKDRNGLSALLWAADMGHLEVVQILIKDGADLTSTDNNGLNALLWAADRGHVDCVHALIATGTDVNTTDKNGYTALHRAANGGFLDVTKALVAANADLRLLDKNAMTALDWAEENDHMDIADLLSRAMNPTVAPFTAPAEAETTGSEAAGAEAMGTEVEAAGTEGEAGAPLTPSKQENAFDEANPIDEDHMTALVLAAHHGDLDQVKQLIAKLGSDVNFIDEHGMSALHYAANAGHLQVVQELLAANAAVNAVDEHGSTPFHWAAANCHLDVVDALLAASADPNAADQHSMTALHWAADMGHLEVLQRLVQVADVDKADENGLSALLWAADRGHVDCVKALLDAGVNVNATDLNSYTALHRASNAGMLDIVTALVAGKADLLVVDKNDMTAYDWAVTQEHDDVAALLKKFMPSPASAAPVIAASVETPLPMEQAPAEETKGESATQQKADEVSTAVETAAEPQVVPAPVQIVYQPAADVQVLRQALEFDAKTIHLKENIICDRYYLQPGFPIHSSVTSVVVNAVDFGLKSDYDDLYRLFCKKGSDNAPMSPTKAQRKMTSNTFRQCVEGLLSGSPPMQLPPFKTQFTSTLIDEVFAEYAKESTTGIYLSQQEFHQFCVDQMGETRNVVIKFMRDEAPYQWEKTIRRHGKLEAKYVVGAIAVADEAVLKEQVEKVKLADPAGTVRRMHNYPHALIMPAADRSLDSMIRQERPDFSYTRVIMRQVAAALQHIHQRGIMHGDLTALNIARINGSMVLVDMDAAVEFGDAGSVTGGKFSSGVLPPEMFATLNREQEQEYEDYWQADMKKNSELWNKVRPVKLRNGNAIVVRTVHPSRPDGSGLPYEIVNASDMIDIWSFGLLLYCGVNPSGNNLLGVNQDGDLVRTEENFNAAANWTDEDLSNAILRTITDDLAADLLQRILRRNPANRCDIVQILAHPFFTDPTATKKGGRSILKSIRKQREQLLKFDRQLDSIFHATETVLDLSDEAFLQIKKSDVVLMRSVFDATELIVPSCFIIVNHKIVEDEGNGTAAGVITSSNWIEHLSDLSNTEDDLYLYLLDEYTMQPVLHVPAPAKGKTASIGNFEHYPFKIQNPSEFVPTVLPLLLLSMKAAALLHGTSTLVNSIGHPNPPVALEKAVSWTGSLDVLASLQEFSNLQDSEEATAHLTGHNNASLDALKVRAKYVRDTALKQLRVLYGDHHALYDNTNNVVNGHHGQARFCGLRRVIVPGGFVCWTQEENVVNIKSGLEATTHLRLVESIAP